MTEATPSRIPSREEIARIIGDNVEVRFGSQIAEVNRAADAILSLLSTRTVSDGGAERCSWCNYPQGIHSDICQAFKALKANTPEPSATFNDGVEGGGND